MKDKEKQSQNNYSSSLGPNNNYYSTNVIKDKEMSIDSSSMNDVSEYMNTIKDENYRNYIQKKYELIARTFHEMDQDNNNYIDCDEMIEYLNKQMPKGEKFDQEMSAKLFDLIDINHDGKCSLNEFSKTYIQIEEELKMQIIKLKARYELNNTILNKYKVETQKYKNERMVEEEIADNAKLTFSVVSVNFNDIINKYEKIYIKLIYRNEIKKTSVLSTHDKLIWNENFDYKVFSINDELVLEIHTSSSEIQNSLIGKTSIPFDGIENQDEFECCIEIPNEKDPTNYSGSIILKLQYIKSHYKFYSEQAMKSENECNEWLDNIRKVHMYYENMNKPFNYFNELNDNPSFKQYNYNAYFDNNNVLINEIHEVKSKKSLSLSNYELDANLAERVDKMDTSPTVETLPYNFLVNSILYFMIFLLIIINIIYRADFCSLAGVVYITLMSISKRNQIHYILYFISITICLISYDLIWMLLNLIYYNNTHQYDGGIQTRLKFISLILALIELLCKICLVILHTLQKIHLSRTSVAVI